MSKYDIFISYARESASDLRLCSTIRENLVEKGYKVFMDLFECEIGVISEAIGSSAFIIACISPDYRKNEKYKRELNTAVDRSDKKQCFLQIIFVDRYNLETDSELRLINGGKLYVDFTKGPFEEPMVKLFDVLRSLQIQKSGCWTGFNACVRKNCAAKDKNTDVMISYTWTPNQQLAKQIKEKLTKAGYSVWIDLKSMSGSMYGSMASAICNSCCFIALLSAEYVDKDRANCRKEINMAVNCWREKHNHFIPLLVGSQSETFKVSEFFSATGLDTSKIHMVDFVNPDFETAMQNLLNVMALYDVPKTAAAAAANQSDDEERASICSGFSSHQSTSHNTPTEHDTMSIASSQYDVVCEKLSGVCLKPVITASKGWPNLDVKKGCTITGVAVLDNDDVVVLNNEKNAIQVFRLEKDSRNGKYEKILQSIEGFVTCPLSIYVYRPAAGGTDKRLVVLEGGKNNTTILSTCSTVLADKINLGFSKATGFVIRHSWKENLFYLGLSGGNIMVIDPKKCVNKSATDEISHIETITINKIKSINIMAIDNEGSFLYVGDNCGVFGRLIVIYNLDSKQIFHQIDLSFCPNDLVVDNFGFLTVLARGNMFYVYSSAREQEPLLQPRELKKVKLKEIPEEMYFLRHLLLLNNSKGLLVCTGHGLTAEINYTSISPC